MKKRFLVVSQAEFTDATGMLINPDGEFGGDDSFEFKDQKEVVLETVEALSKEEAIEMVAKSWEVSPEVLDAYELA